eukprot:tig00021234_g19427.t1
MGEIGGWGNEWTFSLKFGTTIFAASFDSDQFENHRAAYGTHARIENGMLILTPRGLGTNKAGIFTAQTPSRARFFSAQFRYRSTPSPDSWEGYGLSFAVGGIPLGAGTDVLQYSWIWGYSGYSTASLLTIRFSLAYWAVYVYGAGPTYITARGADLRTLGKWRTVNIQVMPTFASTDAELRILINNVVILVHTIKNWPMNPPNVYSLFAETFSADCEFAVDDLVISSLDTLPPDSASGYVQVMLNDDPIISRPLAYGDMDETTTMACSGRSWSAVLGEAPFDSACVLSPSIAYIPSEDADATKLFFVASGTLVGSMSAFQRVPNTYDWHATVRPAGRRVVYEQDFASGRIDSHRSVLGGSASLQNGSLCLCSLPQEAGHFTFSGSTTPGFFRMSLKVSIGDGQGLGISYGSNVPSDRPAEQPYFHVDSYWYYRVPMRALYGLSIFLYRQGPYRGYHRVFGYAYDPQGRGPAPAWRELVITVDSYLWYASYRKERYATLSATFGGKPLYDNTFIGTWSASSKYQFLLWASNGDAPDFGLFAVRSILVESLGSSTSSAVATSLDAFTGSRNSPFPRGSAAIAPDGAAMKMECDATQLMSYALRDVRCSLLLESGEAISGDAIFIGLSGSLVGTVTEFGGIGRRFEFLYRPSHKLFEEDFSGPEGVTSHRTAFSDFAKVEDGSLSLTRIGAGSWKIGLFVVDPPRLSRSFRVDFKLRVARSIYPHYFWAGAGVSFGPSVSLSSNVESVMQLESGWGVMNIPGASFSVKIALWPSGGYIFVYAPSKSWIGAGYIYSSFPKGTWRGVQIHCVDGVTYFSQTIPNFMVTANHRFSFWGESLYYDSNVQIDDVSIESYSDVASSLLLNSGAGAITALLNGNVTLASSAIEIMAPDNTSYVNCSVPGVRTRLVTSFCAMHIASFSA